MVETRIFGDYTVIKQIGQGTLGAVYLAEHRFMKRQYVLKVLPEELSADRSFIQRMEDEIGLLASLDHPNIVKIHNISASQGQYFLVTDCVVDQLGETTNLAKYLIAHEERLDEEELYRLLRQVADALQYAHSKKVGGKGGIAHRGIKLNNILVGKNKNGNIDLYLSDFGLSRIVGTGAVLTRTFQMVGDALGIGTALNSSKISQRYPTPPIETVKLTPLHFSFLQNFSFLSPEQKRIDSSTNVDLKADVYAFGVLAYYLLMGEFPEGMFEMPSNRYPNYVFQWDNLIQNCLQQDSKNRPELILNALDELIRPFAKTQEVQFVPPAIIKLPEIDDHQNDAEIIENNLQAGGLKPVIRTTQLERPETDLDPAAAFHIDTTIKYYVPERKEVKNIQPVLTDMIAIEGGTFYRGSNDGNRDEMPRHHVILNSYAIDIHPVTNEQFTRFLEAMGGEKDSSHQDIIRLRDSRIKRSGGKISIESGYAKHPVVGVTWYGAIAYAKWVGKRLPTEVEWEIAAYGGLEEAALYPTGDDIEKSQANFFSSDTTPVMSYVPNAYGLYDMAGNVYEWCHDWYGYNYYEISMQEPENPQGLYRECIEYCEGDVGKVLRKIYAVRDVIAIILAQ